MKNLILLCYDKLFPTMDQNSWWIDNDSGTLDATRNTSHWLRNAEYVIKWTCVTRTDRCFSVRASCLHVLASKIVITSFCKTLRFFRGWFGRLKSGFSAWMAPDFEKKRDTRRVAGCESEAFLLEDTEEMHFLRCTGNCLTDFYRHGNRVIVSLNLDTSSLVHRLFPFSGYFFFFPQTFTYIFFKVCRWCFGGFCWWSSCRGTGFTRIFTRKNL